MSDDIRDQWALAIAERDRLRSALLDILVVESLDSAHLLANGALDGVTSELDQVIEYAKARDERDRLRAVVDELKRAADGPASEDPSDEPYVEGNSSAWAYVLKVIEEGT